MEILENTTINWSAEFKCYECRSRLRLEPSDILARHRHVSWSPFWYGFICIVCKAPIWLSENEAARIPHTILDKACERLVEWLHDHPELALTRWERFKDWVFSRDSRSYWIPHS